MGYENAKIYKLWCIETDLIYIGSTCNPLYKRFYDHKRPTGNRCNSTKLFELSNDVKIELIEEYPCKNKMELNKREGEHIRLNKEICVNTKKPFVTTEEKKETQQLFRNKNKDSKKIYNKEYQLNNRDKFRNGNRKHYEKNKKIISEKTRIRYEENKEQINIRRRELYFIKKLEEFILS